MKVIETLLEWANDNSEYTLIPELFESALFFACASAMGGKNIRIKRESNNGTKTIIPNFYSVILSKSGTGKDHSRDLATRLFNEQFESILSRLEIWVSNQTDAEGKPDKKYGSVTLLR